MKVRLPQTIGFVFDETDFNRGQIQIQQGNVSVETIVDETQTDLVAGEPHHVDVEHSGGWFFVLRLDDGELPLRLLFAYARGDGRANTKVHEMILRTVFGDHFVVHD